MIHYARHLILDIRIGPTYKTFNLDIKIKGNMNLDTYDTYFFRAHENLKEDYYKILDSNNNMQMTTFIGNNQE